MTKTLLDVPLACADGLRNIPTLYNQPVRDHGQVSDLKSGSIKGIKNFAYGLWDGNVGLVTEPWNGARKEGVKGFMKGVGKGTSGFLTHNGAAVLGIWAYPVQGAYKSLRGVTYAGTQGEILKARKQVASRRAGLEGDGVTEEKVLRLFDEVSGGVGAYEGT